MAHEKYIELGPSASSLVSAVNEFLTTRDRSKQSLISCSQDVWAVGYAIEKLQSEYGRARQRALDYALGLVKTLEADIEADNLRVMGESINIPEPEDEDD